MTATLDAVVLQFGHPRLLGRAHGSRVDVEYVDAVRELRLELVPPPA